MIKHDTSYQKSKNIDSCNDIDKLTKLLDEVCIKQDHINTKILNAKDELLNLEELRKSIGLNIKRIKKRISAVKDNALKQNAFDGYPNVNNGIKEKVWSKAYERGHSGGPQEVCNEFFDLMDIFN